MVFYIKRIVKKGEYLYALVPDHPNASKNGYVLLHRVVVENSIGRLLNENEVVHHINHDKYDCRLENLKLMTKQEHTKLHQKECEGFYVLAICPECKKLFLRRFHPRFKNHENGLKIFCSRSCNGKYYRKEIEPNFNSFITAGYATRSEVNQMLKTGRFDLLKENKNNPQNTNNKEKEIKIDKDVLENLEKEDTKMHKICRIYQICRICGKEHKYGKWNICVDCYKNQKKEILENKILENKERIYKMALEGKTVKQIAESLCLIPQSFSRACRRLHIVYKI